jgi:hypothetical protein
MSTKIRNPFERRTDEKADQWEAFKIYRDMGSSRSMTELSRLTETNIRTLYRWSEKHQWDRRIETYHEWQKNEQVKDKAVVIAHDMLQGAEKTVSGLLFVIASDIKYKQQQWKEWWDIKNQGREPSFKPPSVSTKSLTDSLNNLLESAERLKSLRGADEHGTAAIDELIDMLRNEPEITETQREE